MCILSSSMILYRVKSGCLALHEDTNHHSLYEQNMLRHGAYAAIVAHKCLTAFTLEIVDPPGKNVQLAKLIVNSGGAAALVDYVAEAQARTSLQELWKGSPGSVTYSFNTPQSSYYQPPDLFHSHWDNFRRPLSEFLAWVDGSQIWMSLLHFAT